VRLPSAVRGFAPPPSASA